MSVADPFGLVGQVLDGQFRVDKLVGEGGFSAVYRGHHQGLGEPIAIKSLKLPGSLGAALVETFVQRFRDESRILYRLSQGNLHIVRSMAAGTTQSPATGALVPYMVLEWLEGRSVQNDFTVRRTLGNTGRTLTEIIKLFETAADGLAYAHAQGVVHRDLNPGNLFLATTQHGVKMKVLDFGVAKLMHDGALNMGPRQQTVGQIKIFAPAYGAPEQFDDRIGTVGAFSDVYSFALILIEALRDKSINEGSHIGEFAARACDPTLRPTPRALGIDVPDEVEAAFVRATALDPKERWQSVGDFWQSLTIANKLATERRYESAARETPPLAMGGPAAAGGAAAKANLGRTLAIGATAPISRPGAPRPRIPTTIGIPLPSSEGRPASAQAKSPLSPPTPGLPLPVAPARTITERPAAFAKTADAHRPSSASMKAAPPGDLADRIPLVNDDDEVEEEATKVRAPAPEMLRTLAMHDAANARAQADAIMAREMAARAAALAAAAPPPAGGSAADEDIEDAPGSGGTLMMMHAPIARAPAGLGSTLAMASPLGGAAYAPPRASNLALEPQDWQAPTQARPAVTMPPVQAAPGMQGIPGAHGTPPHGMPAVNLGAMPPHYGQDYGQGGALVPPMTGANAPFGAAQPVQPSTSQMAHPGAPFGHPPSDRGFQPPSYAQPPVTPALKPALPIVPIAIGLAVLALGGLALGGYALRSRHTSPTDRSASASASDSAAASAAVPVPVPVPEETASAAPAPVPPPVAEEVDAAVAVAEAPDAAPAPAASKSASVAAQVTPPPVPPPSVPSPPQGQPGAAAPPPPPKPAIDPTAFNEAVARAKLATANGVLSFCKKDGPTGTGSSTVTFGPDGSVVGVNIDPPFAGTKEGDCVASQFRRVKTNPFVGTPQAVRFSFEVPK